MNYIKSKEEIEAMKEGGKILAFMMKDLKNMVRPGIDTMDLEDRFIKLCNEYKAIPACKNYRSYNLPPFPTGLCLSINDESVHCFPEKGRILKKGDIVAIDTVIKYKGMHADSALTVPVGEVSKDVNRFLASAQMAEAAAIKAARAGNHIGDIGYAMQTVMNLSGFEVLRDFVGHGIGSSMHEQPDIPCFGKKGQGMELKPGMTLAIEALTCMGDYEIDYPSSNPWKTKMADGKNFCIFEHTILVTESDPIILTK